MDIKGKIIRRIEFNWFFTTQNGEAVLSYDIATNAVKIEEGKDGFFWAELKDGEIHKFNNVNTVIYSNPENDTSEK